MINNDQINDLARKYADMLKHLFPDMPEHTYRDKMSQARNVINIIKRDFCIVEKGKLEAELHKIKLALGDGGRSEREDDINFEEEYFMRTVYPELFKGRVMTIEEAARDYACRISPCEPYPASLFYNAFTAGANLSNQAKAKHSPRSGKTRKSRCRKMTGKCLLKRTARTRNCAMQFPTSLQAHGISPMIGTTTAGC